MFVHLFRSHAPEMEQSLEFFVKKSSNPKPVKISAFIPATSFIPGQQIPVTVTVIKGGLQKIRSIGIKLFRVERSDLTRCHQVVLACVKTKDFINPGNKVTYEMDLLIPRKQSKCKTKEEEKDDQRRLYDHEVRISVKFGGFRRSYRLCIPVQIDSIGQKKGTIWEGDSGFLMPIFAFK